MNSNQLEKRTKQFAQLCFNLTKKLPNTFLGNYIKNQLIRCSTSVASNYRSICLAQSKPAFNEKISIVIKDANELFFWLLFIKDEKLVVRNELELNLLISEADQLCTIFMSSIEQNKNTTKPNIK